MSAEDDAEIIAIIEDDYEANGPVILAALRQKFDIVRRVPQPDPALPCAVNVGDTYVCRCRLPRGHEGMHACEHK